MRLPSRRSPRSWIIAAGCAVAATLPGCCSPAPLDARKYFSSTDPREAVVAFSFAVAAGNWEYAADRIIARDAQAVPRAVLSRLADLEVHTDRRSTEATIAPGGAEAIVEAEFLKGYDPGNGRQKFRALLVSRGTIEGLRTWVIDVSRTLEANSP